MAMIELYRVTKLYYILYSSKLHIEYEWKVGEIDIKVRNRTELNLVVYESKVYLIEKIDPALVEIVSMKSFLVLTENDFV